MVLHTKNWVLKESYVLCPDLVHYIHVLRYDTEAHKYVQLLLPFPKNETDKFTVNPTVKLVMKFSLFLIQIRNKSIKNSAYS